MRKLLSLFLIPLAAAVALAKPLGKSMAYQAGDTTLRGYFARPSGGKGLRPGVLVVHEWWGHNAYARKRADMLADLGYAALAVDMYGNGRTASHPQEAGGFAKAIFDDFPEGKARFQAAVNFLKQQPGVDPERIAAIGYCFGGAVVLNMARQGADLDGVASFHGALFAVKPAAAGAIKAKVLVMTGADDAMIPADQVEAFRKEMETAGADARIIVYPKAKHSFTNPEADEKAKMYNLPMAYNRSADKKSWRELQKFLKEIFSK